MCVFGMSPCCCICCQTLRVIPQPTQQQTNVNAAQMVPVMLSCFALPGSGCTVLKMNVSHL